MSTASQRAMMTWLGTLARGGVIARSPDAEAGEAVAAFVIGEARVDALRAFLERTDEATAARERQAAVEVCIWMAHADREIHPEETHLLRMMVAESGLDADAQDALVDAVHAPPSLEGVETRLTHEVLRELILALAWELALADGRVDHAEDALYRQLAARFGIADERAEELRAAISQELG